MYSSLGTILARWIVQISWNFGSRICFTKTFPNSNYGNSLSNKIKSSTTFMLLDASTKVLAPVLNIHSHSDTIVLLIFSSNYQPPSEHVLIWKIFTAFFMSLGRPSLEYKLNDSPDHFIHLRNSNNETCY